MSIESEKYINAIYAAMTEETERDYEQCIDIIKEEAAKTEQPVGCVEAFSYQWQPINNYKLGAKRYVIIGRIDWPNAQEGYFVPDKIGDGGKWFNCNHMIYPDQPTHWMPWPSSPSAKGAAQEKDIIERIDLILKTRCNEEIAPAIIEILYPYIGTTEREISFVDALVAAQNVVEASPLYHKFIDGTPLQNDIAVWMAEFAVNGGRP